MPIKPIPKTASYVKPNYKKNYFLSPKHLQVLFIKLLIFRFDRFNRQNTHYTTTVIVVAHLVCNGTIKNYCNNRILNILKMKKKINQISLGFSILILFVSSCKKKEQAVSPPIPGNETLTTIGWRFQNAANAADTVWAFWQDLNVANPAIPPDTSHAICNLKKSTTYYLTVHIYDSLAPLTPGSIDLTNEIAVTRANYHMYFFFPGGNLVSATGVKHVTITASDHDTNSPPLPIGMHDTFVTDTSTCNGWITGILRHQPNSKNGTFAPGSTDSQVTFSVNIH